MIEYSGSRATLVRGDCQEVHRTKSRASGPRRWRRAVEWLIAAGLHPRANATTLRVAEDLAVRMDYSTGHVLYRLDEMVARLGISRASICRHIGYLRELGALAWVQHGTRTNLRRTLGLGGYAGTATVYAATIPAAYDHAMGHTVIGSGYTARIVIDQRGQTPTTTGQPVDNSPVDNPTSDGLETPSLTVSREEGKQKVDGGEENYTSRERASRDHADSPLPTTSNSARPTSLKGSTNRDATQAAEDIRITRLVRALVNWTQREGLRRLAYSLRPLIDQGLDSYAIAEYLHGLCSGVRWSPRSPASYIRTTLATRDQAAKSLAEATARFEREHCPEGAFTAPVSVRMSVMAALDQGRAAFRDDCKARGLDYLSTDGDNTHADTWDAEADVLALLNGSPA
ncbi:hypothetical protein [Streptomyces sp. NPDC008150]|uniref:hypothetical protein n=1 Tax=Streptomyces sp. NPDC008150 TaxID=3364816 RepID=UPI0036E7A5B1